MNLQRMRMTGRCSNGFEADRGRITHLVDADASPHRALCGTVSTQLPPEEVMTQFINAMSTIIVLHFADVKKCREICLWAAKELADIVVARLGGEGEMKEGRA